MENIKIKGIYNFEINIPTMFNNYTINVTNHNIVTFKGESYFLNRWINNDNGIINKLVLGNNSTLAHKTDTTINASKIITDFTKTIDDTNLILQKQGLSGSDVNGCTEIGIYSDDLLLTRDVFTTLSLPSSSEINIDYYIILDNGSYDMKWTADSESTNVYYGTLDAEIKNIIEEDNPLIYTEVSSKNNLKNGTYFLNIESDSLKLYIKTSDGDTPSNHDILITYKE